MLDEVAQKADVVELMAAMGRNATAASAPLAVAATQQKDAALLAMADAILADTDAILEVNALDMKVSSKLEDDTLVRSIWLPPESITPWCTRT